MLVTLDLEGIDKLSDSFRGLGLKRDSYENTLLFPPPGEGERELGFFVSMVAIDHRTRTELTDFSASIGGRKLVGSDLLYNLGTRVYMEEGDSFTLGWLRELSPERAKSILCFEGTCIWDFFTRIFLLRDVGSKVESFSDLLDVSTVEELARRLGKLRAYEDPVQKKIMLLAKFLDGRGLISLDDPERVHVPVDNHLTRLALRLGIVRPSRELSLMVERGVELTMEEDVEVRTVVRDAWKEVSIKSEVDPFTLDDFLWAFGRSTCHQDPYCDECPFKGICRANLTGHYWMEPKHTITWYY